MTTFRRQIELLEHLLHCVENRHHFSDLLTIFDFESQLAIDRPTGLNVFVLGYIPHFEKRGSGKVLVHWEAETSRPQLLLSFRSWSRPSPSRPVRSSLVPSRHDLLARVPGSIFLLVFEQDSF